MPKNPLPVPATADRPARRLVRLTVNGREHEVAARPYDVLAMPREYGLRCPVLEGLSRRFYETTVLRLGAGEVHALRAELARLTEAYCARRGPELARERGVRARDPAVRRAADRRAQSARHLSALPHRRRGRGPQHTCGDL